MVWMDAGCTVCGYWSDFSRAAVVGRPSPEQEYAQEAIHNITWEAIKMVRPGVPASDLARFCFAKLGQLSFPTTSSIARRASRIGHGVGLVTTEPPHLGEHDDTPLAAGMIITLEPGAATSYGTFHIEENLLVTPEGSEVLSQVSRVAIPASHSLAAKMRPAEYAVPVIERSHPTLPPPQWSPEKLELCSRTLLKVEVPGYTANLRLEIPFSSFLWQRASTASYSSSQESTVTNTRRCLAARVGAGNRSS